MAISLLLTSKRWPLSDVLGEFLGTFLIVFIGVACNASMVVNKLDKCSRDVLQAILWGFAVSCAYYTSGRLSRAHYNPAVTVSQALVGKLHDAMVVPYILAQLVGALVGSLLSLWMYKDLLVSRFDRLDGGSDVTLASVFAPQEDPRSHWFFILINSFAASFFLVILLSAVLDATNMRTPNGGFGLIIGSLAYSTVLLAFSSSTFGGPAINPARDLAPQVIGYVNGQTDRSLGLVWGKSTASFFGAAIGGSLYTAICEYQWLGDAPLNLDRPVGSRFRKAIKINTGST